jgi:hypothetical protein
VVDIAGAVAVGEVRGGRFEAQSAVMPAPGLQPALSGRSFTVAVPVRLDARPSSTSQHRRAVILSSRRTDASGRTLELGVDGWQRPYVSLHDGDTFGAGWTLHARGQLRLGQPNLVVVRADPALGLTLFVAGRPVGHAALDDFEERAAELPVVGGRPSVQPFGGAIGDIFAFRGALPDAAVRRLARQLGLDPSPLRTPVRQLTHGPAFHWFGYYDKFQTSPDGRYVLGMQVDFENRSPRPDDVVEVGMVDLQRDDRWIRLGTSRAWNWQQGCMLQWRPGSDSEVLWNDREAGHFVTRIYDVETQTTRSLSAPIYHVAPDGKLALGLDFARIQDMRAGYGYAGVPDPDSDVDAPRDSTIYTLNLQTGEVRDIVALADVAAIPWRGRRIDAKQYFNHLQFSPDGERFLFLHRWRTPRGGFQTRFLTADVRGGRPRVLTEDGGLSHYAWRDPRHVLIWSRERGGYALYRDGEGFIETVLRRPNGHQTYLPDRRWLVSDTYPDRDRLQKPFLYDAESDEIFLLGAFEAPHAYRGEFRVDNHPRIGRHGRRVFIDSAHRGGRQIYMIDASSVLDWQP